MSDRSKNALLKLSACAGYGAILTIIMALFQYFYHVLNGLPVRLDVRWFIFTFIGGVLLGAFNMWYAKRTAINHDDTEA